MQPPTHRARARGTCCQIGMLAAPIWMLLKTWVDEDQAMLAVSKESP